MIFLVCSFLIQQWIRKYIVACVSPSDQWNVQLEFSKIRRQQQLKFLIYYFILCTSKLHWQKGDIVQPKDCNVNNLKLAWDRVICFLKASFFVDLGCSRWNAEGETYQHPLLVESAACWARSEQLNHSVSNNRLWEILCLYCATGFSCTCAMTGLLLLLLLSFLMGIFRRN